MYSKTMQQVNIALNITHKLKQTHYVVFTAFNRKMRHNLRYTNGASEPVTQELPFYDIIHVQVWQINVCLIQLYIGATLVQHLEHKYISHARMRRGDVQKGQLSLLRWSLESWVQETESVQCACVMDTSSYWAKVCLSNLTPWARDSGSLWGLDSQPRGRWNRGFEPQAGLPSRMGSFWAEELCATLTLY